MWKPKIGIHGILNFVGLRRKDRSKRWAKRINQPWVYSSIIFLWRYSPIQCPLFLWYLYIYNIFPQISLCGGPQWLKTKFEMDVKVYLLMGAFWFLWIVCTRWHMDKQKYMWQGINSSHASSSTSSLLRIAPLATFTIVF